MRRRLRRTALAAIALAGVSMMVFGGGWAVLRTHIEARTGRPDLPAVTCLYCHRSVAAPATRGPGYRTDDISPAGIAVDETSRFAYVTGAGNDSLLKLDLATRQVVARAETGSGPLGLALSPDQRTLAVACRDSDEVMLLEAASLKVLRRLATGAGPTDVVFMDGRTLAVSHGDSRDVGILPLEAGSSRRLPAGQEPYALARSADGRLLAAVSRLVKPTAAEDMPGAQVTFIHAASGRVQEQRLLWSAHLSEDIALSADGSYALVPLVRFRHFLPTTQVARGAVMTSALAFLETDPDGAVIHFPLDEVNGYFADPSGLALTPDERLAFVASGGADVVSVIDLEAMRRSVARMDPRQRTDLADDLTAHRHYVLKRIATGANPRALAMTPDGGLLLVAEHLADRIGIIDVATLKPDGFIDLGGPVEVSAARRGARVFHDATATFQGQFSCRSCHPDGHTDGLIWDFEIDGVGRNRLETRSLRGLRGTAPFKWNGKNPDLHTQCGPRFSRVLMRAAPFADDRLDDLVHYIESLPLPPPRSQLLDAEAVARGEALFFRTETNQGHPIPMAQRCSSCHRPPLFTDRFRSDVGTGGAFDTPHLAGVGTSPPYLHDGRALTLEEIWTVHSPDDTHGITNDLDKVQLNDLVLFLRSL